MDLNTSSLEALPPVFCDWLDVTFPVDSPLWGDVAGFLLDLGCTAREMGPAKVNYRLPDAEWGSVQLSASTQGWSRISTSGASCGALRALDEFDNYLSIIAAHPHTVTRIDSALDFSVDAPPIIQALCEKYPPESKVNLTRKGISPTYELSPLPGNKGITGTFYAGDLRKRQKVMARVYDKQAERASRGVDIPPRVRYELVTRKGVGITLLDAQNPTPLFFHFMSPALLNKPSQVPGWEPFTGELWAPGRPDINPYARLKNRINTSVDLQSMLELADSIGPDGRHQLLRMIRSHLGLTCSIAA